MDNSLLTEKFERMGARLRVGPASRGASGIAVDIRHDHRGEYFDVRVPADGSVNLDVLDVRPGERHLLLMAKPHAEGGRRVPSDRKQKFLCGHDERAWFVAAVPEAAGASNVPTAMAALKPPGVRAAEARAHVPAAGRNRRKNRAFVRQGEWFFVPLARALHVDEALVLRNERLVRSSGGKPHVAEFCYRTGGEVVYYGPAQYGVLGERKYRELVLRSPHLKASFRQMRANAGVYVKGRVRHPDHKTITLHDWHEVQMNTETQAQAMRHVVFLD